MRGEVKLQNACDNLLKRVQLAEKRQDIQRRLIEQLLHQNKELEDELRDIRVSHNKVDYEVRDFKEKCNEHIDVKKRHYQADADREANRLRLQVKRLSKELEDYKTADRQIKYEREQKASFAHQYDIARARTIAIYDNILFAIENWSTDGQTAADITLLLQSILFPTVYEPIMSGDEDYYFQEVPPGTMEFVKRARKYVKSIRNEQPAAVTSSEDLWIAARPTIHEWLLNDGLPLLYGACADNWASIKPTPFDEMLKWRDEPASRALKFPLIYDAMELITNNGDEIRATPGLAEFNRNSLTTRIEP